jgi:sulfide dehydrogenase cytochrome subunit
MTLKQALGWLLGVSLLAPALAADEDLRAYMLASSCAACHGPEGASPGAIPPLQGKSAAFIELALKEFRSGASEATVMGRLAKGYSEEEIALIARWYGRNSE